MSKLKTDTQLPQTIVSKSVTDKEFRIGNFINYRIVDKMDERKEWLEVSEIDHDDLRIFGIKYETNQDYQPIEITEDWLCKLGFNKTGGTYEFIDGLVELVFHKGEVFEVIEGQWKSFKHIKHLHQLQNLYFALTGRELTVC